MTLAMLNKKFCARNVFKTKMSDEEDNADVCIERVGRRKATKRAKKTKFEDGNTAIFLPLERPVLADWNTTARLFNPNDVCKMPSPNQNKTKESLGDGVVAKRRFKKGEVVCSYGGKVLSADEHHALVQKHDYRCGRVAYFIALVPEAWYLDGHPSNLGSQNHVGQFINDARGLEGCETNCMIRVDATHERDSLFTVQIEATRAIQANEELFISYDPEKDDQEAEAKPGYWTIDESLLGKCDCRCLS